MEEQSATGSHPAEDLRPTVFCGRQVCGMHPEHLYTEQERTLHCPGSAGGPSA